MKIGACTREGDTVFMALWGTSFISICIYGICRSTSHIFIGPHNFCACPWLCLFFFILSITFSAHEVEVDAVVKCFSFVNKKAYLFIIIRKEMCMCVHMHAYCVLKILLYAELLQDLAGRYLYICNYAPRKMILDFLIRFLKKNTWFLAIFCF